MQAYIEDYDKGDIEEHTETNSGSVPAPEVHTNRCGSVMRRVLAVKEVLHLSSANDRMKDMIPHMLDLNTNVVLKVYDGTEFPDMHQWTDGVWEHFISENVHAWRGDFVDIYDNIQNGVYDYQQACVEEEAQKGSVQSQ